MSNLYSAFRAMSEYIQGMPSGHNDRHANIAHAVSFIELRSCDLDATKA